MKTRLLMVVLCFIIGNAAVWAVACNDRYFDLDTSLNCDDGWPSDAFCVHWQPGSCNGKQGVDSTEALDWIRECESGHPNKYCGTRDGVCKQKFFCAWSATQDKCVIGSPIMPVSWAMQQYAYSDPCGS